MSTVASVHELAQELLDACEAVLATTVGGPPAAVFLSPGLPALDRQCDTLSAYATAPAVTGASSPGGLGASMRFAVQTHIALSVMVARCLPVGRETKQRYLPPTAQQLTGAAQKVMEDMWALWNGVVTQVFDGSLFEGHPCRGVEFLSLTPLDPQGGFGGWTLALQVDLDGYEVSV